MVAFVRFKGNHRLQDVNFDAQQLPTQNNSLHEAWQIPVCHKK
jgi:hypothetical protein